MAPKKKAKVGVPRLEIETIFLKLTGTSPLISHAWSGKAKREMADKQAKKAKQAREARVPARDFVDSLYWLNGDGRRIAVPDIPKDPDEAMAAALEVVKSGKFGMPSVAFKAAAVTGAGHVDGITKVGTRGSFHVLGEFVTIDSAPPVFREDMVRVGMGSADLRYRGEFLDWSATLAIELNTRTMSVEQMVNLFNVGGFAAGIGDWRPQKNGSNGRFMVALDT